MIIKLLIIANDQLLLIVKVLMPILFTLSCLHHFTPFSPLHTVSTVFTPSHRLHRFHHFTPFSPLHPVFTLHTVFTVFTPSHRLHRFHHFTPFTPFYKA